MYALRGKSCLSRGESCVTERSQVGGVMYYPEKPYLSRGETGVTERVR